MFYLAYLVVLGAGTYLYNFGFKQKSTVVKIGGAVVSIGAVILIVISAIYGPVGKGWKHHGGENKASMCPMMNMGCGCGNMGNMGNVGNVEVQRPPITPDKYHQPAKHLMTDPMEAKPKK